MIKSIIPLKLEVVGWQNLDTSGVHKVCELILKKQQILAINDISNLADIKTEEHFNYPHSYSINIIDHATTGYLGNGYDIKIQPTDLHLKIKTREKFLLKWMNRMYWIQKNDNAWRIGTPIITFVFGVILAWMFKKCP